MRLASSYCVAFFLISSICLGQSSSARRDGYDPELEARDNFRSHAQAIAGEYELHHGADGGKKYTRVSDPILRWSNPLGGHQAHGEIFLWTNDRVPVAVLSINQFTRANGKVDGEHEWCSLSNEPIAATGPHLWSPSTAGVSFVPFPSLEAIADPSQLNVRQMRGLASRVSGTKTTRAGDSRALRLLPQPLYRYQAKETDVLEGGLFALVEATDPEALLLLEARRSKSEFLWYYAFARLNSVKLTGLLDNKPIWEAPALPGRDVYDRVDKPYSAFLVK